MNQIPSPPKERAPKDHFVDYIHQMTIAHLWLFFGLVHHSLVQVSLLSEMELDFPITENAGSRL